MNRYILNTDNILSFSAENAMISLVADNEECFGEYLGFYQEKGIFNIFLGGGGVLCFSISNMSNTPYYTVALLSAYLRSVTPNIFRLNNSDSPTPTTIPVFTPPNLGEIDPSIAAFFGNNP